MRDSAVRREKRVSSMRAEPSTRRSAEAWNPPAPPASAPRSHWRRAAARIRPGRDQGARDRGDARPGGPGRSGPGPPPRRQRARRRDWWRRAGARAAPPRPRSTHRPATGPPGAHRGAHGEAGEGHGHHGPAEAARQRQGHDKHGDLGERDGARRQRGRGDPAARSMALEGPGRRAFANPASPSSNARPPMTTRLRSRTASLLLLSGRLSWRAQSTSASGSLRRLDIEDSRATREDDAMGRTGAFRTRALAGAIAVAAACLAVTVGATAALDARPRDASSPGPAGPSTAVAPGHGRRRRLRTHPRGRHRLRGPHAEPVLRLSP